jgi:chitin disaccharide deacetylase
VGLHLALLCGRSALGRDRIPGLLKADGRFSDNPVAVGFRYFARRGLRAQLRAEMSAQFDRFHATGLTMDHLNGHLHLHMHPVVFDLLMEHAFEWGIVRIRLTREPYWLDAGLASGHRFYRAGHALIHQLLSRRSAGAIQARGLKHTRWVFGLLQNARVNESYLLKLLPVLPAGDSELYSHPSLDEFPHELAALVSPRVKALAEKLGLQRIRYADL